MSTPSLYQNLLDHAKHRPTKTAITLDDQEITYGTLLEKISFFQKCIKEEPAQLLALSLPNSQSIDLLSLFIAGVSLGHNVQILNDDWPDEIKTSILKEQQPDIFTDSCSLPHQEISSSPTISEDTSLPFYTGYTSGSTGGPKGFVRSQQSWLDSFRADQEIFDFHRDDIILAPGSLAHSLFFYAVIRGLYLGGTVVLSSSFRPDRILTQLKAYKATIAYMTPTQIRALLDYALATKQSVQSLRLILSSGSKLPIQWLEEINNVFPNQDVYEFYGTSELSYISTIKLTKESQHSPDSTNLGQAFPTVDIQILDRSLSPVSIGETGKIFIKSKFQFIGYAGPARTTSLGNCETHKGYISVGDLGFIDHNGDLHLMGRKDRMFQSMGRNIYPEEIERILLSFPTISHAAIFKQPDPKREYTICAVLLRDVSLNISDVVSYCRSKLPSYSIPYRFYLADHWPKTVSDKTDLKRLEHQLNTGQLEQAR